MFDGSGSGPSEARMICELFFRRHVYFLGSGTLENVFSNLHTPPGYMKGYTGGRTCQHQRNTARTEMETLPM